MTLLLTSVTVAIVGAVTLLLPGLLAWPAHILTLFVAAYVSERCLATRQRVVRTLLLWPGLALTSGRALAIPFMSMLSRLPEFSDSEALPPLWAKGGVALIPVLLFALAQAWLVVHLSQVRTARIKGRVGRAGLTAGLATVVSIAAELAAIIVGVVLAGLSVEMRIFPADRDAYFGLFWMSLTTGVFQPLGALFTAVVVSRIAARRAAEPPLQGTTLA